MFGGVDKRGYSPSPAEKIAYIANELLKQLDLSAAIEKAQNSARLATERGDHDVAFVWKQVEMHLAQSSTKM
jgi:ribosomal protein S19E (S16A)